MPSGDLESSTDLEGTRLQQGYVMLRLSGSLRVDDDVLTVTLIASPQLLGAALTALSRHLDIPIDVSSGTCGGP